tara:strand:+ start:281 stop:595 length:315 start_codon:yes stop_codon:yes gene_type:complete
MWLVIIVNILLVSVLVYNFTNTIVENFTPEEEYELEISKNNDKYKISRKKYNSIEKKIKNLNKNNQINVKNITSNENAIKDIQRVNNGEDIDTSKACESDPKLC